MSSFRTVAGRSCASHEGLALALAEELGSDAEDAPLLARGLADSLPRTEDPAKMVAALARLPFTTRATGPLLLPEVLERGGGNAAGVAVATAVVGQAAGYAIGLVGCGNRMLVAHHFANDTLVIDPAHGLIDARTLGHDLHWRCAHESAAVILELASERAERGGDIATAIAAQALALALPLEDVSRTARERAHKRLLARLN